jgi:hypothetical protein
MGATARGGADSLLLSTSASLGVQVRLYTNTSELRSSGGESGTVDSTVVPTFRRLTIRKRAPMHVKTTLIMSAVADDSGFAVASAAYGEYPIPVIDTSSSAR